MNNEVYYTYEGIIRPNKHDKLLALIEEFIRVSKIEDKLLKYEYYFNADKTKIIVHKRFSDSDAAVLHVQTVGYLFRQLAECIDIQPFYILGNLDLEAREMFSAMGGEFTFLIKRNE